MTWFKVDDGFWRHRKVRRLGKDRLPAAGLWVLAGDYCADNTTDGFLTRDEVAEWDPRLRYAARLVDVGLWHEDEVDGEQGFRFHQWEQHQPSREQVLDRRRKRQDAGRRGGIRSGQARRGKPEANASASASPSTEATAERSASEAPEANPNPVPSRPENTPSNEGVRSPSVETAGGSAATIVAEWIERCRKRPPRTVIGQISKHVKAMLGEGITSDDIRRGLADWMTRDLHPSVLPSLVNSAMNTRASPVAAHPTDANIARLLGIHPQQQLPGGQS